MLNISVLLNNTVINVLILAMIATIATIATGNASAGVYLLIAAWIGSGQGSAIITKVGSLDVITLELCGLHPV